MMRFVVSALAAMLIAGCQTLADDAALPAPGHDRAVEHGSETHDAMPDCPAAAYQALVGQSISEIHTDSLPSPHRIYARGDIITMDHRPDRLNIVTADDGRVIEVKCG